MVDGVVDLKLHSRDQPQNPTKTNMDDEANLDPYLQLGLDPTATEKDIKSAYRKKSLKCHPDRVSLA